MSPVVLMVVGAVVFVTFVFVAIANFSSMIKANIRDFSFGESSIAHRAGKHLMFGFIAMLGAFTFLGGLAWFLVDKFVK